MSLLDAIAQVLGDAGTPLHYRDITSRVLDAGLWTTEGATPEATVNARLAVELKEHGRASRFLRVEPGIYGLRASGQPKRKAAATPVTSRLEQHGKAVTTPDVKLGMREVRDAAKRIVREHPEGIRYGELLSVLSEQNPGTNRNTIQGSIWNLDAVFPDEIEKPTRGLFKPIAQQNKAPPIPAKNTPVREDEFYDAFADWLKNDLGDATEAIPFGGASLGKKWGTPDVLGVYKPRPSDRIRFDVEIISAEVKVDPQAPVVAFGQAIAYRLFSTKTYVVMPKTLSQEDLDRLEALCMLFGVGLVLFTPDPRHPDFEIRMRAQRFSPDMYFVNEFADSLHRHDRGVFDRLFQ